MTTQVSNGCVLVGSELFVSQALKHLFRAQLRNLGLLVKGTFLSQIKIEVHWIEYGVLEGLGQGVKKTVE